MNAMTATTMLAGGDWFKIEGPGYQKTGAILGVAGGELPDFRRLSLGLILSTDATVGDDGSVIGDPTEAAFVVLAAKMGADAQETREALPRRAEVPFDSEYKFMATFHDRPGSLDGGILQQPHFATVKGAPDVVVQRCGRALWHGEQVPIGTVRDDIREDRADRRQLRDAGPCRGSGPRHLPADLHLRQAAADDLVVGAAAHGVRHHLQHQRRRRPVPAAAAVLQVLRRIGRQPTGASGTGTGT
jgi:hypothetical protein